MALHWALLAVAAAQDWGELYGRRTQSLPEGMELNETLNGPWVEPFPRLGRAYIDAFYMHVVLHILQICHA